ncbi:hypothetical protein [Mangrovitalea sediminis]|uniref:hypothetical protein n=1 Tax=Mangrovitalea sediminis TaxID=1982043 RepID=UPI001D0CF69B|nr:hypothetical protein [Mangrovitalea sediminis]
MNEYRPQNERSNRESRTLNQMYGTYSDVLFVLFPFLIIALQRLWSGEGQSILLRPDLSIAAAILGGLAIGKFVLSLIADRELDRYRERIVFFIALTLFIVLGPALILMIRIVGGDKVPDFVSFVQPILLIISISLYTTAISVSSILTRPWNGESDARPSDDDEDDERRTGGELPEALDLPRRQDGL